MRVIVSLRQSSAFQAWLLLLAAALFAACHGSGRTRAGKVTTKLAGHAVLSAPLTSRTVEIFDDESARESVARALTNSEGAWEVDIGPLSGTLRVEVQLGDERGGHLETITGAVQPGATTAVEITPVTNLIATYARVLSMRGDSKAGALTKAADLLNAHFGKVDHTATRPFDVASGVPPAFDDGVLIGILLSGLEEETEVLSSRLPSVEGDVSTASFVLRLMEDLEDGVFDGLGARGPLTFAGAELGPDTLRGDYARAIARFLDGPKNRTSLRSSDVRVLLDAITHDESALFPPNSARTPQAARIRTTLLGPDLSPLPSGRPVRGTVYVDVAIEDDADIASVGFTESSTSGAGEDLFTPGKRARLPVNTTLGPDGQRLLHVIVTDAKDVKTTTVVRFVADNTPPAIAIDAPSQALTATVPLSITATDAIGPVDVVLGVDGAEVRLGNVPSTLLTVIAIPCGRDIVVSATAEDAAGNTSAPAFAHTRCSRDDLGLGFGLTTVIDESDLIVTHAGEHLVYAPRANARVSTISEATAETRLRFEKYFTRFDSSSENVPLVRLVLTGSVAELGYRHLIDGREHRSWSPLPVATQVDFPISYDTLGRDLVLAPPHALHRLEFRVRDPLGRTRSRALEFELDVLSPPLWIEACSSDNTVAFAELGPLFLSGADVRIGMGGLAFILDLQESSLTPNDGVLVDISPITGHSDILELSEQKFFAETARDPWWIPATCGQEAADTGYEGHEDWTGRAICGLDAAYPDDQVFYHAASDGRVNDPSASPARVEILDGGRSIGSSGSILVPANRNLTFRTNLTNPILGIQGRPYDWSTAFDAPPAGYIGLASTSGRYRIGAPYRHEGSDILASYSTDGMGFIFGSYSARPFTTRAAIHRFRITSDPVRLTVHHSSIPALVVPVVTSSICQQPISLELHE